MSAPFEEFIAARWALLEAETRIVRLLYRGDIVSDVAGAINNIDSPYRGFLDGVQRIGRDLDMAARSAPYIKVVA